MVRDFLRDDLNHSLVFNSVSYFESFIFSRFAKIILSTSGENWGYIIFLVYQSYFHVPIHNDWLFEKSISELENLLILLQNVFETGKEANITWENGCVISWFYYFDFLVSCLYTSNSMSLWYKWVRTWLVTTYSNMESG